MLPRGKRLARESFPDVARGKRAISAHFSITVSKSEEGRAAVVVSKKVAKSSVGRHRLKRQIFEAIKKNVRPGYSFIVYARAGSTTLPFQELSRELGALLDSVPAV